MQAHHERELDRKIDKARRAAHRDGLAAETLTCTSGIRYHHVFTMKWMAQLVIAQLQEIAKRAKDLEEKVAGMRWNDDGSDSCGSSGWTTPDSASSVSTRVD